MKQNLLQFFIGRHSRSFSPPFLFFSFRLFPPMKNPSKIQKIEPEKVLAERINGWAAMLGFFAAVGAYLTTGQIIPGVV